MLIITKKIILISFLRVKKNYKYQQWIGSSVKGFGHFKYVVKSNIFYSSAWRKFD
jgi:hypothetical protein